MAKTKRVRPTPVEYPLKAVLAKYGWSQRKLARSSGIDYNRVNDLANGRHLPTWPTAVRIAATLGASLGDFQLGALPPPAKPKPKPRKRAKRRGGKLVPISEEG